MNIAYIMLDPMIGKRNHRAGGAVYSLDAYLKQNNKYKSNISTKIFNFNSLYIGPVNLYILAVEEFRPDIIAFSTYCWNVELVKSMAEGLKCLLPQTKIVLGGPEVSFNAEEVLSKITSVDIIIRGEGELIFNDLVCRIYEDSNEFADVLGLTYRKNDIIISNSDRPLHSVLDDFPSPFLTGTIDLKKSDGEVAFETLRGCQFRCSYCLHTKGLSYVREFSYERIEEELKMILSSPYVKIIWFLDPTFNANEERAINVLKIVEKYNPNMPLAFEIRADLLTDRLIEQFSNVHVAEVGIGLQSYSEEVNKNVNRRNNIHIIEEKLFRLKKAISKNCVQFDIDLIYGLPGDRYSNYKHSVDYVLYLGGRIYYQPLRVFKGTQLSSDLDLYKIVYNQQAPYNIICNESYTREEMVLSYCLNVGIDFINREGVFKEVIHLIVQRKNCSYSHVLESIGKYYWEQQMYDIFRISNWSPDDRNDRMVFKDFKQYIEYYISNEKDKELIQDIINCMKSYGLDSGILEDEQNYSKYGYFHLTI